MPLLGQCGSFSEMENQEIFRIHKRLYPGDIDNDGKDELVFLLVTQTGGSTLGSDRSFVISWNAK